MIFFDTKKINKIYIPQSLIQRLLSWYHEYLLHPGRTRIEKTIKNTMTFPGLTQGNEHLTLIVYVPLVKYIILREVLILLPLESSGYQYQDGINHPQEHLYFSLSFLGDTQMLLHILQGLKASMYTKRGLKSLSH
jgi:hypothetical protein